jgi:hypothetical protein
VVVAAALAADLAGLAAGVSSLPVLSMALVLCLLPLLWRPMLPASANSPAARKTSVERIVRWSLIGLPFRFAGIIGGGCLLYRLFEDRLGVVFWLAVVCFYQMSLLLHVAEFRAILSQQSRLPQGSPAEH